jgi:hypothetical protein
MIAPALKLAERRNKPVRWQIRWKIGASGCHQ